jgi:hypothetical protein
MEKAEFRQQRRQHRAHGRFAKDGGEDLMQIMHIDAEMK